MTDFWIIFVRSLLGIMMVSCAASSLSDARKEKTEEVISDLVGEIMLCTFFIATFL